MPSKEQNGSASKEEQNMSGSKEKYDDNTFDILVLHSCDEGGRHYLNCQVCIGIVLSNITTALYLFEEWINWSKQCISLIHHDFDTTGTDGKKEFIDQAKAKALVKHL